MCCTVSVLLLFGPRLALLVWYLINPVLFKAAFSFWLWPVLFAVFAPFTMIFFMFGWYLSPGISGFEWILIIIGIFIDISSYGGGYRSRRRI